MLMWIHEAAAYHTLLASGAERSRSCNVPHWLYWISAAWPQYKGWLQTLTRLRLPTWLIYKSLSDLIHRQQTLSGLMCQIYVVTGGQECRSLAENNTKVFIVVLLIKSMLLHDKRLIITPSNNAFSTSGMSCCHAEEGVTVFFMTIFQNKDLNYLIVVQNLEQK